MEQIETSETDGPIKLKYFIKTEIIEGNQFYLKEIGTFVIIEIKY